MSGWLAGTSDFKNQFEDKSNCIWMSWGIGCQFVRTLDATHTSANTHQREPHWAKNKLIARRGQDQGNTTRLTLVSPKAAGAPVSRVTLHCSNWATARAVAETSPSVLLDFLARVLSSGYLGRRPIPTQSALNGSIEWRRSDQHRPGDADSPTIARN